MTDALREALQGLVAALSKIDANGKQLRYSDNDVQEAIERARTALQEPAPVVAREPDAWMCRTVRGCPNPGACADGGDCLFHADDEGVKWAAPQAPVEPAPVVQPKVRGLTKQEQKMMANALRRSATVVQGVTVPPSGDAAANEQHTVAPTPTEVRETCEWASHLMFSHMRPRFDNEDTAEIDRCITALDDLAAWSAGRVPTGRESAPQDESHRFTREGLERSATELREQAAADAHKIYGAAAPSQLVEDARAKAIEQALTKAREVIVSRMQVDLPGTDATEFAIVRELDAAIRSIAKGVE